MCTVRNKEQNESTGKHCNIVNDRMSMYLVKRFDWWTGSTGELVLRDAVGHFQQEKSFCDTESRHFSQSGSASPEEHNSFELIETLFISKIHRYRYIFRSILNNWLLTSVQIAAIGLLRACRSHPLTTYPLTRSASAKAPPPHWRRAVSL